MKKAICITAVLLAFAISSFGQLIPDPDRLEIAKALVYGTPITPQMQSSLLHKLNGGTLPEGEGDAVDDFIENSNPPLETATFTLLTAEPNAYTAGSIWGSKTKAEQAELLRMSLAYSLAVDVLLETDQQLNLAQQTLVSNLGQELEAGMLENPSTGKSLTYKNQFEAIFPEDLRFIAGTTIYLGADVVSSVRTKRNCKAKSNPKSLTFMKASFIATPPQGYPYCNCSVGSRWNYSCDESRGGSICNPALEISRLGVVRRCFPQGYNCGFLGQFHCNGYCTTGLPCDFRRDCRRPSED